MKIYMQKIIILLVLLGGFQFVLTMQQESVFSGIVVVDLMFNKNYIETLQQQIIQAINQKYGFIQQFGKYKPTVIFIKEKMPHLTLIEIHDLPLTKKDLLLQALSNAQMNYIQSGRSIIQGIKIEKKLDLLGKDENKNKFPVIMIDENSPQALRAYTELEFLKKLVIENLNKKGLNAYYKTYDPWRPHISLGKTDKPLDATVFSGLIINAVMLGEPLVAYTFTLLGPGSRKGGYPIEMAYSLYSIEKGLIDLVTGLEQIQVLIIN